MAAFRLAWKQGADGIEGDFRLTKDSRIVCIHDETTARTAGIDLTVSESTFRQLRKLDAGSWKGDKWAGQRIPVIEEVFSIVPADKKIFIEIKCGTEIVEPLRYEIDRSKLNPEQIIVITFDESVLSQIIKYIPLVKALWLSDIEKDKETGEWAHSPDHILRTLNKINADGLSINAKPTAAEKKKFPVKKLIAALQKIKKEFHVWNVNDIGAAAYFSKFGVDSMTTDRPMWLRHVLTPP